MATSLTDEGYRRTRFAPDANRETLWATLCSSYFQRLIGPEFHVLELGAGYANFINNIRCRTRTAVDLWPGLPEHVRSGVTAHVGSVLFSLKSRLPVWPWLIRLYLRLPWKPLAKQMFVRAKLG